MAEPDNRGALVAKGAGVADISVAPETTDRALRVLDALIRTAEAMGHSIGKTTTPAMLWINGAHVRLTISERFYRDSTPADAQELVRRQQYERRYPKFFRRMDLTSGWTHRASGKLSIILSKAQYITGIPSHWHDLASHPVETRLSEVVEAAIEHAEVIKTRQRQIDERLAERRAEEEEQKRERATRGQLAARAAFLQARVDAFDRAVKTERYLQYIKKQENWYPTPKTIQYVQFAEAHIEDLRLVFDAAALERDLAESGLW